MQPKINIAFHKSPVGPCRCKTIFSTVIFQDNSEVWHVFTWDTCVVTLFTWLAGSAIIEEINENKSQSVVKEIGELEWLVVNSGTSVNSMWHEEEWAHEACFGRQEQSVEQLGNSIEFWWWHKHESIVWWWWIHANIQNEQFNNLMQQQKKYENACEVLQQQSELYPNCLKDCEQLLNELRRGWQWDYSVVPQSFLSPCSSQNSYCNLSKNKWVNSKHKNRKRNNLNNGNWNWGIKTCTSSKETCFLMVKWSQFFQKKMNQVETFERFMNLWGRLVRGSVWMSNCTGIKRKSLLFWQILCIHRNTTHWWWNSERLVEKQGPVLRFRIWFDSLPEQLTFGTVMTLWFETREHFDQEERVWWNMHSNDFEISLDMNQSTGVSTTRGGTENQNDLWSENDAIVSCTLFYEIFDLQWWEWMGFWQTLTLNDVEMIDPVFGRHHINGEERISMHEWIDSIHQQVEGNEFGTVDFIETVHWQEIVLSHRASRHVQWWMNTNDLCALRSFTTDRSCRTNPSRWP